MLAKPPARLENRKCGHAPAVRLHLGRSSARRDLEAAGAQRIGGIPERCPLDGEPLRRFQADDDGSECRSDRDALVVTLGDHQSCRWLYRIRREFESGVAIVDGAGILVIGSRDTRGERCGVRRPHCRKARDAVEIRSRPADEDRHEVDPAVARRPGQKLHHASLRKVPRHAGNGTARLVGYPNGHLRREGRKRSRLLRGNALERRDDGLRRKAESGKGACEKRFHVRTRGAFQTRDYPCLYCIPGARTISIRPWIEACGVLQASRESKLNGSG